MIKCDHCEQEAVIYELKTEVNDLKLALESERIANLKGFQYQRCRADKLEKLARELYEYYSWDKLPEWLLVILRDTLGPDGKWGPKV